MNTESHQNDPSQDDLRLPPELVRVLAGSDQVPAEVRPEIEAAIFSAARATMSEIRGKSRLRIRSWMVWPLTAAAGIALVFAFRRNDANGTSPSAMIAREEDAATIMLREFSALYPNQVKAIIQDSRGIQLTLADKPDVTPSQALVLKVCQKQGCEEIITFSGQSIEIAGHSVTVRTEKGGRVILEGDRFVWTSDLNISPSPGIHIESRRL